MVVKLVKTMVLFSLVNEMDFWKMVKKCKPTVSKDTKTFNFILLYIFNQLHDGSAVHSGYSSLHAYKMKYMTSVTGRLMKSKSYGHLSSSATQTDLSCNDLLSEKKKSFKRFTNKP